jgi:hypothetical protein
LLSWRIGEIDGYLEASLNSHTLTAVPGSRKNSRLKWMFATSSCATANQRSIYLDRPVRDYIARVDAIVSSCQLGTELKSPSEIAASQKNGEPPGIELRTRRLRRLAIEIAVF